SGALARTSRIAQPLSRGSPFGRSGWAPRWLPAGCARYVRTPAGRPPRRDEELVTDLRYLASNQLNELPGRGPPRGEGPGVGARLTASGAGRGQRRVSARRR